MIRLRRSLTLVVPLLLALVMGTAPAPALAEPDEHANEHAIDKGWKEFREKNGLSHAAGGHEEMGPYAFAAPTGVVSTMRIGIRYSYTSTGSLSEFANVNHPSVQVKGTVGTVTARDVASGSVITTVSAGTVLTVTHDGSKYTVKNGKKSVGYVIGPVRFSSNDPNNTFAIPSIKRMDINTWSSYITPEYRGEIEIARGSATPSRQVNLVNIVPLETYIKGNVVNESPAYFHPEALKAQATVSRGYAVANVGRWNASGYPFDLDDSPASQVYRGKTSEHVNGNTAVDATAGLVLFHNGTIVNAMYSSSLGGHPESIEWSFSGQGDPAQAVPYLVGRYDGPAGTEPDLTTEAGLRAFWANDQPQVYDSQASAGNSRNRWTFVRTRADLESIFATNAARATVVSGSSTAIGTLSGCDVTLRSPTGRAVRVRCTGSAAVWDFVGWDNIRRVFPHPTMGVLSNPAFLDPTYNADGSLASITVIGGGWGHNVGMSQYGANGRGKAGQTFQQILSFYYKDSVVGPYVGTAY
ncbi:MAG TPA: SpoIID/LytB domain-containing protein [Symbiobacteriaceae bacterium]|nr:SpoIID/LytB domain-containing protein [Symbiobacteriaceae bacterium]